MFQSCKTTLLAFAFAILLSKAKVQIALLSGARVAPSLVALSASSFLGILRCLST